MHMESPGNHLPQTSTPCNGALKNQGPSLGTLAPSPGRQAFLGLRGERWYSAYCGSSVLLRRKAVRAQCRKEKKKHVSSVGRCYYRPTKVSERTCLGFKASARNHSS